MSVLRPANSILKPIWIFSALRAACCCKGCTLWYPPRSLRQMTFSHVGLGFVDLCWVCVAHFGKECNTRVNTVRARAHAVSVRSSPVLMFSDVLMLFILHRSYGFHTQRPRILAEPAMAKTPIEAEIFLTQLPMCSTILADEYYWAPLA